jgi:crotonobetainyl-CoA:carnitine CoA-transferase CaiB-like acyl-CoA transferase
MPSALPLAGIRVLDLTRALAGPFGTMILANLGAEVIKVEPLPKGEMTRLWSPFAEGPDEASEAIYYLSTNRNKKSLAIDFRKPQALTLLRRLAGTVDVLADNFKPGVMVELGLDYAQLAPFCPRLISVSISGYGRGGPYGEWPGFDQVAQGMSGFMSLTGEVDGAPMRSGLPVGDLSAGMWAATGVLAAIVQRQTTGKGQRVETSLLGALVGMMCVQGQRYLSRHENPPRAGNDHPTLYPYGAFAARDGLMIIAVATQAMWLSLCGVLDLGALADDSRFAGNEQRMANRDALRTAIEARLMTQDGSSWARKLVEAGIPAGPIYTLDRTFADPQVIQQRMVETVAHPTLGPLQLLANPIKLDAFAEGSVRTPPPLLGQHDDQILHELGLSEAEIAALRRSGVIAD